MIINNETHYAYVRKHLQWHPMQFYQDLKAFSNHLEICTESLSHNKL